MLAAAVIDTSAALAASTSTPGSGSCTFARCLSRSTKPVGHYLESSLTLNRERAIEAEVGPLHPDLQGSACFLDDIAHDGRHAGGPRPGSNTPPLFSSPAESGSAGGDPRHLRDTSSSRSGRTPPAEAPVAFCQSPANCSADGHRGQSSNGGGRRDGNRNTGRARRRNLPRRCRCEVHFAAKGDVKLLRSALIGHRSDPAAFLLALTGERWRRGPASARYTNGHPVLRKIHA